MAAPAGQAEAFGRDQIDRVMIFEQRDVRMMAHLLAERSDDRMAGRVGRVNDPAMAMAAFARQMKAQLGGVVFREWHALFDQPFDRGAPMLDDKARRSLVAQTATRDQRVAHVIFDAVRGIQHRGDTALRPVARALGQRSLGDHSNAPCLREVERDAQASQTATDNRHIEFHYPHLRLSFCDDGVRTARRENDKGYAPRRTSESRPNGIGRFARALLRYRGARPKTKKPRTDARLFMFLPSSGWRAKIT
ncbi:hypothetical protein OKW50_000345 [Paraburkholderia youngii]